MKLFNSIKKTGLLLCAGAVFFSACNKLELEPVPTEQPQPGAGTTIAALLDDPSFSLLKSAATRVGLIGQLADTSLRFTVFAPDDAAIVASLGVPNVATAAGYIASLSDAQVAGLISYHIVPQILKASSIFTTFPNHQYPTILNPAPSVSALLRLTTFPSVRPGLGAWVNNVPIIATDIMAVNGVVHKVFRLVSPPSVDLWQRIDTDTDLTFLKAAINRADSGALKQDSLRYAISLATNSSAIGSNLTIFAPNDAAMKAFLIGAITKALLARVTPQPPTAIDSATAQGTAAFAVNTFGLAIVTDPYNLLPAPFNAQLAAALTPTTVKGLVVYHILSSQLAPLPTDTAAYRPPGVRVFSVNIPSSATTVKTLLNSGGKGFPGFPNDPITKHPGVIIQAAFASPFPGISVVTAATVKGAANATASNLIVRDLHCVNGVIHKIDQVLLPQ
jgi:uncharacterized surface protein with fasciclin (FAS1) repeats